jgi:hypothetical protein
MKPVTMEEFEKNKTVDQTLLLSDLSHQLEEARAEIEKLQAANREWVVHIARAEGARDALKELLRELYEQRNVKVWSERKPVSA